MEHELKCAKEDKSAITIWLFKTILGTRTGDDVAGMWFEKKESGEYVIIKYMDHSYQEIDVTADSGFALIKDVVNHIRY